MSATDRRGTYSDALRGAVRSGIPMHGGCLCGRGHRQHCPAVIADKLGLALAELLEAPSNKALQANAAEVLRDSLSLTRYERSWEKE